MLAALVLLLQSLGLADFGADSRNTQPALVVVLDLAWVEVHSRTTVVVGATDLKETEGRPPMEIRR